MDLTLFVQESRISTLNDRSDDEMVVELMIGGEARYTLPNGTTTLFVTNEHSDFEMAMGVRQSLGDIGTLSVASTLDTREVWENPYLVGVARRDTNEISWGASDRPCIVSVIRFSIRSVVPQPTSSSPW